MSVITSTADLREACRRLAAHDYVAVDTEFLREQTFWPQLCLIQLAGPDQEMIVDPLAAGIDLAPFYELMADESVVKVFHAGRQDIEIVYCQSRIIPAPLFDTQVAAMVCGFGESVSYVNLVKKITGINLDKGARFTDWSRRPLSPKQLTYALADVTHLRDVYASLETELKATERAHWLSEEMATLTDPATYELEPENAWQRLKLRVKNRRALAILIELAAWRERIAQSQNVPRARVLRDEALYDIANQGPTEPEQLEQLRSLSNGFSRSARGREILEAVRRGHARDTKDLPKLQSGPTMPPEAGAIVDLLRVLLKACAARHRVAAKLLADTSDLERLATEDDPPIAALRGWRRELFGEQALRLKRGELALGFADGEVVAVERTAK